ncbi:MotA/TolQ/ExbB proton channel family protein [Pseudomonas sp. 21TX0197]|uniref:MotA/TolQ/ExbB proton channel family protein n=2 Tax=Pseudomonas TaxID=286 RepID=UPI000D339315|nr:MULTISPECIES: MotA/TolQ/ExbB proton channel family protein [Pseudomonas]VVN97700.1 Protein TolQ [Pseudomonas fluorescens]MCR8662929.1 MotA/TolQ/ExbB proton channel family protein [Pseudomonas carnis]MDB6445245.1 MotA/TolQ/ExbB proton channel family protein [Pseudomonas sp. 21TX0197]MDI3251140.1 MotA/TolQ/ExbB proton channel family protein [Pseudomonas sp. AL10]MDI3267203.1 MotA/TolQ/ExbB proton channel family protein [Pseudomonas sp. AL15]
MQELGLAYAWDQADYVSKTIAFVLIAMSILSWSVMLLKTGQLLKLSRHRKHALRFWNASNFIEGVEGLSVPKHSPFRELALAGHAANAHQYDRSSQLHQRFDLSDWLARCLKEVLDDHIAKLQAGLAILASIGSTAPFVGLFGTVWGIYHALKVIGTTGDASLAQVAGPVGESLIMTAFGLFVAIPAVLGYNTLARQNKGAVHQLSRFAHDLHAFFLTGARVNLDNASGQSSTSSNVAPMMTKQGSRS